MNCGTRMAEKTTSPRTHGWVGIATSSLVVSAGRPEVLDMDDSFDIVVG
jgi:hypothetical protein